jgi:hypothetical protein
MSCIEVLTSGYIVGRYPSRKDRKMKHADTGGSNRCATAVQQSCSSNASVVH